MFKVKLGQPRNKQLLRMMEDPEKRKAIDKAELSVLSRHAEGRTFCVKGRVILYHRRKVAGGGSLRAGSLIHEPGRSERLRPTRSDQRVH